MVKSKKWIYTKITKISKAKNLRVKDLSIPSELFLIYENKETFTKLKQVFNKALILNHFDLHYYIWIKTCALGDVIGMILSLLISDNLGQWHPVVFFSQDDPSWDLL